MGSDDSLMVKVGMDTAGWTSGLGTLFRGIENVKGALAGLAVVGAGSFAVNKAQDFEKHLALIQNNARGAILPTKELGDSLQRIASVDLAGNFNQTQVAEALSKIITNAGDTAEALDLVTAAGKLAAVTGADLGSTAETVSSLMGAWGLSSKEAARAAQVLFETSRQTGTGIEALSANLRAAAPWARNLKLEFADTAVLFGVLKDAGVDSAEQLLSAWAKTGGEGGIGSLLENIKKIGDEALASGGTSAAALLEAFGMKGGKAAEALYNNFERLAEIIPLVASEIDTLNPRVERAATEGTKASKGFEDLTTELGQHLLPAVNGVLGGMNKVFDFLNQRHLLDEFAGAITTLAGAYVVWRTATFAQAFASGVLSGAMLPVTLTVLGIAAAVGVVILAWKNWDKISAWVIERWQDFKDGLATIWAGIKDGFDHYVDLWVGTGKALVAAFGVLWTGLKDGATATWGFVSKLWESLTGLILDSVSGFTLAGANIVEGLLKGITGAWGKLTAWWENATKGILAVFRAITDQRSPSKVFESYGENLVEGLRIGLGGMEGVMDEALARVDLRPEVVARIHTLTSSVPSMRDVVPLRHVAAPVESRSVVYSGDFIVNINGAQEPAAIRREMDDWWLRRQRRTGGVD